MIRLGLYQFRSSFKTWATAGFVFIIAGWLIGFCLTGFLSIQQAVASGLSLTVDPTPLFIMPMVFGGITLFFVLGGLIRGVIQDLKGEYQLWLITGATPGQISVLVAVQLALTGICGSLVGYELALLSISPLYQYLQSKIGTEMLPTIDFRFSILGLIATCSAISLTCLFTGLLRTRKALRLSLSGRKPHKFHLTAVILMAAIFGLSLNVVKILSLSELSSSRSNTMQPIFPALISLILIQVFGGRKGATKFLTLFTRATSWAPNGVLRTARWQAIDASERMTTAIVPILVVQTLVVGLYELLFGMADANTVDLQNVWVAFLVYAGSPLILVIANIVTVAMLKSRLQEQNISQLSLIGFTRSQLFLERGAENCFQLGVLLAASIFSDAILYGLMVLAGIKAGAPINISFVTEFNISLSVVFITLAALWLIDVMALLTHPSNKAEKHSA